jgi:hypothetical protein
MCEPPAEEWLGYLIELDEPACGNSLSSLLYVSLPIFYI